MPSQSSVMCQLVNSYIEKLKAKTTCSKCRRIFKNCACKKETEVKQGGRGMLSW